MASDTTSGTCPFRRRQVADSYDIPFPQQPLSPSDASPQVVWLSLFAIVLSQGFTKISILVFYGRLATGSYAKLFTWGVRVGILYNVTSSIAFTLTIIFTCRPINAYWNQFALGYHGEYSCLNEQIALPLSSVFSVLGDLYATLLPLLLLKGLQLPRRQKWMIYSLFSLGFLCVSSCPNYRHTSHKQSQYSVVAAGTVRTVYLYQLMDESYDITCSYPKIPDSPEPPLQSPAPMCALS
jgi:hypothetical protein